MISALSAMLAVSMAANGWGAGHDVIRQMAVDSLPEWQRELLGDAVGPFTKDYLKIQDQFAGGNRPDLAVYCTVPDCALSLHDIQPVGPTLTGVTWYLTRVSEEIAAGDTDEAAKYLGVLCHWFEDPGSPTMHCVRGVIDEWQLRELIPPPPDKRRYHYLYGYSGIGDTGRYEIPEAEITPALLGRTIPEAAFHLQQCHLRTARTARAGVVPIVSDEMYGDGAEAARVRGRLIIANTRTIADLIYTALCLASGRFDDADTAHLDATPLTDFISDYAGGSAGAPYKWVPFLEDASFDAKRNMLPIQLPGADGEAMTFERGIGMGAPFTLAYSFGPGEAVARFCANVGLHPAAGDRGSVKFIVKINGAVVVEAGPITSGSPGEAIDVPIPDDPVIKLELITERGEGSVEDAGLAIWAEPTLHASR